MEVILLEKVENLGNLGDKVAVRAGYARNFLIPGGKAKYATAQNIAEFEARRAELEKIAAKSLSEAEARQSKLENLTVTIPANAGAEGKLFGSVGTAEIAEAVTNAGVPIEKREVRLHLYSDVNVDIKVEIVPEEA